MGNGFLLPTSDRTPTPVHKLSASDYELDEDGRAAAECPGAIRAFNCAICQGSVGWDIVQTPCGHRFCQRCIVEWVDVEQTCPYCKAAASRAGLARLAAADQAQLGRLRLRCARKDRSGAACRKLLYYGELEEHALACPLVELRCHYACKQTFLRREQESHLRSCRYRPVACPQCGEAVPFRRMRQHVEKVHRRSANRCPACAFEAQDAEGLALHARRSCPEGRVQCPFPTCRTLVPRRLLAQHLETSLSSHLEGYLDTAETQEAEADSPASVSSSRLAATHGRVTSTGGNVSYVLDLATGAGAHAAARPVR